MLYSEVPIFVSSSIFGGHLDFEKTSFDSEICAVDASNTIMQRLKLQTMFIVKIRHHNKENVYDFTSMASTIFYLFSTTKNFPFLLRSRDLGKVKKFVYTL